MPTPTYPAARGFRLIVKNPELREFLEGQLEKFGYSHDYGGNVPNGFCFFKSSLRGFKSGGYDKMSAIGTNEDGAFPLISSVEEFLELAKQFIKPVKTPVEFRLNSEYKAVISEKDGATVVQVGCQTFTKEVILELAEKVRSY